MKHSADIDEFELPVAAGDELIGFLKTAPGAGATLLQVVQIYGPGIPDYLAEGIGGPPNADIEARSTGLVSMPAGGTGRIAVVGAGTGVTTQPRRAERTNSSYTR